uniref:6-phosphogluconolactonase n=1 Tax=viral metagenome TaxID=1070528 RepID=A0A6C0AV11_9ZZZZ|tara:strand:- start:734 stop:1870 length:1137 start_codon:yes stop_codon:yes gene_type:complete
MNNICISSYTDFHCLAHAPSGTIADVPLLLLNNSEKNPISIPELYNPAFMIKHPKSETYYACLESINEGHIATISDMKLKQILKCGGKSSCFLAFDPSLKYLVNINYWDSSISIHSIDTQNYFLSEALGVFKDPACTLANGLGEHLANRQSEPHYHSALFIENDNATFLLVPDLGTDKIHIFEFIYNSVPSILRRGCVNLPSGSGPRYIIKKNNVIYVVNELNSTVTTFEFACAPSVAERPLIMRENAFLRRKPTRARGRTPELLEKNTKSTLPPDFSSENSKCGGITLHETEPYLLVSNRGHNSISIFKCSGFDINIINIFSTLGATPRHFTFSTDFSEIYVANQDSDCVTIFSFTNGMTKYIKSIDVCSPNFILTL